MAWSEHLDRGVNIRSLRCRYKRFCFESLPEKSVQFSGKKQTHSVDKCILVYFVRNHLYPVATD